MTPAISTAKLLQLVARRPAPPLPGPPPPTIPTLSDAQAEKAREQGWQLRSEARADAWRPPARW